MSSEREMEIYDVMVLEEVDHRDKISPHNDYSLLIADVQVKCDGKIYDLIFEKVYDNQNGGIGIELKTQVDDEDLELELINYVEKCDSIGELF